MSFKIEVTRASSKSTRIGSAPGCFTSIFGFETQDQAEEWIASQGWTEYELSILNQDTGQVVARGKLEPACTPDCECADCC